MATARGGSKHPPGSGLFAIPWGGHYASMRVCGVDVPASGVAQLSVLLERAGHRGLAQRIGIAVDRGLPTVGIYANEYALILNVLDEPPVGLEELRGGLLREVEWRRREGL